MSLQKHQLIINKPKYLAFGKNCCRNDVLFNAIFELFVSAKFYFGISLNVISCVLVCVVVLRVCLFVCVTVLRVCLFIRVVIFHLFSAFLLVAVEIVELLFGWGKFKYHMTCF